MDMLTFFLHQNVKPIFRTTRELTVKTVVWPERFVAAYLAAKTPRQRVDVTVRRIRHFIATHGEK